MTAEELKDAMRSAAAKARIARPDSADERACMFVAYLSGAIEARGDKALADDLFSILSRAKS